MSIQAPYRGRNDAPAQADKATDATDKPVSEQEEAALALEAAKRERAPQDEEEVAQEAEEEDVAEEESTEAPDSEEVSDRLRHADYTRKTQALAEERKQLEAAYGGYAVLDRFLTDNPQLAKTHTLEQIVYMLQSPESVTATNQPLLSAGDRRAINEVRNELKQERESLFFERTEEIVRSVAKRYGMTKGQVKRITDTLESEDLVKIGMTRGQIRAKVDLVARALDHPNAQKRGQTKLVQKLKEKQKAASAGATNASPAPEPRAERTKGWDALIRKHTPK